MYPFKARPHVSAGTRVHPSQRKPKKPRLEDSIRIVGHNTTVNAVSIDGNCPLSCPLWKYRDADREHHVDKYRTWFYDRVNTNNKAVMEELDKLIEKWQETKGLVLSHDKPHLPNHGSVIIEFVCYELRRRGLIDPTEYA